MSMTFATEIRLLAEEELEPIRRSHFPLLEELPREALQELARWLRARRNRARDLMSDHRRAKRGQKWRHRAAKIGPQHHHHRQPRRQPPRQVQRQDQHDHRKRR